MHMKAAFVLLSLAVLLVQAKPSVPFGFHGIPDHLDLVPPVLPPAHFHAAAPQAKFLTPAHFHAPGLLPAPAPVFSAPAPFLPAPAPLLPAPAPLLPAPAPLLPAPVVHHHTHIVPAPTAILPPVFEPLPFVAPAAPAAPSYRAIPGPKTTTHHISVGYAFPQPRLANLHSHVHALPHVHSAPLSLASHHHHHTVF